MRAGRWYTYGGDEGAERMARLLGRLKPGDLFVFKSRARLNDDIRIVEGDIRIAEGGGRLRAEFLGERYSTEYAVMRRTAKAVYGLGAAAYDPGAEPDAETAGMFYEPRFLGPDGSARSFESLDDPVAAVTLAAEGVDVRALPVFSAEYDDRNMFVGENGAIRVVFG